MLAAETAVLVELKPVRIVLLILERVVVPLLAFGAGQCNFDAHLLFLLTFLPSGSSPVKVAT
jgi:hypothetical protein